MTCKSFALRLSSLYYKASAHRLHNCKGWTKPPVSLTHEQERDTSTPQCEAGQCSIAGTKTTLFLPNLGFNYRSNSPLQYPGVDLSREAEKCDSPIIKTHPPVFKKRYHHSGLPLQRCSSWLPTARSPLMGRSHPPGALAPRGFLTTLVTSAWVMESPPQSPRALLPQWNLCWWDWGALRKIPSIVWHYPWPQPEKSPRRNYPLEVSPTISSWYFSTSSTS